MDIMEIIKDAIVYPFSDIKTYLIIGVLFFVTFLFENIRAFTINSSAILLGSIIALVISLWLAGYELDVINVSANRETYLPALDPVKQLVGGIKFWVLKFIYYLIPIIIILAIGLASGTFEFLYNICLAYINGADIASLMTGSKVASFFLVMIVSLILLIIFDLLLIPASARLAVYDELGSALNIIQSYHELMEINVIKAFVVLLILAVIGIVLTFIAGLLTSVAILYLLIVGLIFNSFRMFIRARSYGLLYSDIE